MAPGFQNRDLIDRGQFRCLCRGKNRIIKPRSTGSASLASRRTTLHPWLHTSAPAGAKGDVTVGIATPSDCRRCAFPAVAPLLPCRRPPALPPAGAKDCSRATRGPPSLIFLLPRRGNGRGVDGARISKSGFD